MNFFGILVVSTGNIQNYPIFGQSENSDNNSLTNIPTNISGITCDKMEHLMYHNHTKIIIRIQNETIPVPAGIGIIPNSCIFWLHTHDDSGIIHVESPTKSSFTLEQFIQVWDNFENTSLIDKFSSDNFTTDISIISENNTQTNVDNYKDLVLENNAIIDIKIDNKSKN